MSVCEKTRPRLHIGTKLWGKRPEIKQKRGKKQIQKTTDKGKLEENKLERKINVMRKTNDKIEFETPLMRKLYKRDVIQAQKKNTMLKEIRSYLKDGTEINKNNFKSNVMKGRVV